MGAATAPERPVRSAPRRRVPDAGAAVRLSPRRREASIVTDMPDSKLQLAVLAAAFSTDAREAASAARVHGFGGLLFDAFSSSLDVTTLSQTGRREFRHVLSGTNQQLVGLRVDVGPKGFGPGADIDRLLRQFEKVMEAAKG